MLTSPIIALPIGLLIAALFLWTGSLHAVRFYRNTREYTLERRKYRRSYFFVFFATLFVFFSALFPIISMFGVAEPDLTPLANLERSHIELLIFMIVISTLITLLTIPCEYTLRKLARRKEPNLHFTTWFWLR